MCITHVSFPLAIFILSTSFTFLASAGFQHPQDLFSKLPGAASRTPGPDARCPSPSPLRGGCQRSAHIGLSPSWERRVGIFHLAPRASWRICSDAARDVPGARLQSKLSTASADVGVAAPLCVDVLRANPHWDYKALVENVHARARGFASSTSHPETLFPGEPLKVAVEVAKAIGIVRQSRSLGK